MWWKYMYYVKKLINFTYLFYDKFKFILSKMRWKYMYCVKILINYLMYVAELLLDGIYIL